MGPVQLHRLGVLQRRDMHYFPKVFVVGCAAQMDHIGQLSH